MSILLNKLKPDLADSKNREELLLLGPGKRSKNSKSDMVARIHDNIIISTAENPAAVRLGYVTRYLRYVPTYVLVSRDLCNVHIGFLSSTERRSYPLTLNF